MSLRASQSSVATLNHKNINLVNFDKRQSSKNMCMLQDKECCRQEALVRTTGNDAFPKEKNASSRDFPGTLDSSDRQVSVQGAGGIQINLSGPMLWFELCVWSGVLCGKFRLKYNVCAFEGSLME